MAAVIEGLEMDIVTHDVKKFFAMLLKKNGYVLEQLYSPLIVHTTPEHAELKQICSSRGCPAAHSSLGGDQRRVTSAATGVGERWGERAARRGRTRPTWG